MAVFYCLRNDQAGGVQVVDVRCGGCDDRRWWKWKVVAPAAGRGGAGRWDGELVALRVEQRARLFVSWLPVEVSQGEGIKCHWVGTGIERAELKKQLCHPAVLLFEGFPQPCDGLVGGAVGLGVGVEEVAVVGGEQLSCTLLRFRRCKMQCRRRRRWDERCGPALPL